MQVFIRSFVAIFMLFTASFGLAAELTEKLLDELIRDALIPTDGHFVVEITRDSISDEGSAIKHTRIEYWVNGNDTRFDVRDIEGGEFDYQVVLKNGGEDVLFNPDAGNARVVLSQVSDDTAMAKLLRSEWLYFQALLGRFPNSALALYEKSFLDLKQLKKLQMEDRSKPGGPREMFFSHTNGRSMSFQFRNPGTKPNLVEVRDELGKLRRRLLTKWEEFDDPPSPIAYSGSRQFFSSEGTCYDTHKWRHTLAEKIDASQDAFTWDSMEPAIGKKLVVAKTDKEEQIGGNWNGEAFTSSPLAVKQISGNGKFLLVVGLFGLFASVLLAIYKFGFNQRSSKK